MAKILAVDDALVMRSLVSTVLESDGHTVVSLESGESALKYAKSNNVDLVITDQHMEGIRGTTLVRRLRGMANYADTPMLLLTTETDVGVKQTAKEVGANGWVQKPIVPDQFLAGVTRVLTKYGLS